MPQQLHDRLMRLVVSGGIRPGDAVPVPTALAADCQIHPAVVERAYQALTEAGVIDWHGDRPRVSQLGRERASALARRQFIDSRWPVLAAEMQALGIAPAALLAALNGDQ